MNEEPIEEPDEQPAEEFVAELVAGENPAASDSKSGTAYDSAVMRSTTQVIYDPSIHVGVRKPEALPPSPYENLAAKGGAVGAVVLGALAFIGSFITTYAILNSFMGVLLGLWGLRSNHRNMALIGIGLCLLSGFFCVVEISAWIQSIWPESEF